MPAWGLGASGGGHDNFSKFWSVVLDGVVVDVHFSSFDIDILHSANKHRNYPVLKLLFCIP
jgi:hypothetical protein